MQLLFILFTEASKTSQPFCPKCNTTADVSTRTLRCPRCKTFLQYKCMQCNTLYHYYASFYNHLKHKHQLRCSRSTSSANKPIQSVIKQSKKNTLRRAVLKKKIQSVCSKQKLLNANKCPKCGTKLTNYKCLLKHLGWCGQPPRFYCDFCPFKSAHVCSFNNHLRTHMKNKNVTHGSSKDSSKIFFVIISFN